MEYGVGEACEDQIVAWECYIAMLEMDDHLQALNIEEWQVMVALDDISLDNELSERITRIST